VSRRFAAEAALVGAALLYGITFPLVHDALADITPFAYLLGRFGIATLILFPFALPALRTPGADRRMLVRAGLTAGVILFGGYATQTIGLQYTSPSTSAFITGLYVVITPVIESLISRRLPRPPVIAGIVIATIGLYLLTGADVHLGKGEVLTLACAVLFAFHIVYIGAYANLLAPSQFTGLQIGAVAVLSVAPAAQQGVGSLSTLAVFAVVFTGIACSALALPMQLWGQRRIPATRAALILLAEPVFAGIAGYVDGERLGAGRLVGGAPSSWASWCGVL
jgi:drug/metabolite transporter (DMT)-like permease